MATFFHMPKLSVGKAEAVLTKWLVPEGTAIKKGTPVFALEAGKLSGSVEADTDAVLLKQLYPEGSKIKCGSPAAIIGAAGENIATLENEFAQQQEAAAQEAGKRLRIGIVGGGPGGYVAAIRAAQLGAAVTLIEKTHLGGTCLNEGCIPTKALLHCAKRYAEAAAGAELGVLCEPKLDFRAVMEYKRGISERLIRGIQRLLQANEVELIAGTASFVDAHTLKIAADQEAQTRTFDRIILATGSNTVHVPVPGFDLLCCIDSTRALSLDTLPQSMVIVGGGVIGMEMAAAYADFGTKVTVVEMFPHLLNGADQELVVRARQRMEKLGVVFHTGSKVIRVDGTIGSARTTIETPEGMQVLESELVLVCTGRKPNTESLMLENAGVACERGRILTDGSLRTNVEDIYAIGDCTSPIMLAHVASAQGEIAAENAMGAKKIFTAKTAPNCVYMEPELASVGMTEEQAHQIGIACTVGRFDLSANGKALIENGGYGMVKIITEPVFNRIIGMQILGPHASDMIAEAALALRVGAKAQDLIDTIHPHPSVSEAVHEAALAVQGRAIHA